MFSCDRRRAPNIWQMLPQKTRSNLSLSDDRNVQKNSRQKNRKIFTFIKKGTDNFVLVNFFLSIIII